MLFILLSTLLGMANASTSINLKTTDGSTVHAAAAAVSGSKKGVVFVHMLGRDSRDWDYLSKRLNGVKLSTIAIDLRGHGKSARAGTELTEADFQSMGHDLAAGVTWLRSKGVTDVSCVGASIGANLCAQLGAADPGIVNLVLLSPGLNYKGVTSGDALQTYGDRPVLIVAADDDRFAPRAAAALEGAAKGQVHYELLVEGGHGTKMLTRDAKLEGTVTSWLIGTFKLVTGEVVRPKAQIKRVDDTVETSGRKMQVHQ
jgi:alpha-beta hydrolase superfamily lysophospholipase